LSAYARQTRHSSPKAPAEPLASRPSLTPSSMSSWLRLAADVGGEN
jgi:hypothetical protein